MSNEYAPNGVSFLQIKKDAKKIKKEQSLTHLESLDLATKNKTNFSSWKNLESFVKSRGENSIKLNFYNNNLVLYKKSNMIGIFTRAGGGKTLMLIDTVVKNAHKFKKIGFVNKEMNSKELSMRLPENTVIIESVDKITEDMDCVVIDTLSISILSQNSEEYIKLKNLDIPVLYSASLSRNSSFNNSISNGIDRVKSIFKLSKLFYDTSILILEDESGIEEIKIELPSKETFVKKITILNKIKD